MSPDHAVCVLLTPPLGSYEALLLLPSSTGTPPSLVVFNHGEIVAQILLGLKF